MLKLTTFTTLVLSLVSGAALASEDMLKFGDVCNAKRVALRTEYENLFRAYFGKVRPELKAELDEDALMVQKMSKSLTLEDRETFNFVIRSKDQKVTQKYNHPVMKKLLEATTQAMRERFKDLKAADVCTEQADDVQFKCEPNFYKNEYVKQGWSASVVCGCYLPEDGLIEMIHRADISFDSTKLISFTRRLTEKSFKEAESAETAFALDAYSRELNVSLSPIGAFELRYQTPERTIKFHVSAKEHDSTFNWKADRAAEEVTHTEMIWDEKCSKELTFMKPLAEATVWDGVNAGIKGAPVSNSKSPSSESSPTQKKNAN